MQRSAPSEVTPGIMLVASILPNYWQGERGCAIGPFRSRAVAHAFLTDVLHANHVQVSPEDIVVRRDAFYIEVGEGVLTSPKFIV